MKKIVSMTLVLFTCSTIYAQDGNVLVRKGNQHYKKGEYDKSVEAYKKAREQNPSNIIADYNLGNALFRKQDWIASEKKFDETIATSKEVPLKEKSYYNKGVSLTKQEKLEESIEAYKNALKLDPNDADARHNLQKALMELKKKNESENKKQNQEQEQKKQQQKQKPKQQQSKLKKKQVENLLKALQQREQEVQRRMQQNKSRSAGQPEKDW
jgi:Ca-activated chloride channel homolog